MLYIFHNQLSPYRIPFFIYLSERIQMTLILDKYRSKDRKWSIKIPTSIKLFLTNNFNFKLINSSDPILIFEGDRREFLRFFIKLIKIKRSSNYLFIVTERYSKKPFKYVLFDKVYDFIYKFIKPQNIISLSGKVGNYNHVILYQTIEDKLNSEFKTRKLKNKKEINIGFLSYFNKRKRIHKAIKYVPKKIEKRNCKIHIAGSGKMLAKTLFIIGKKEIPNFYYGYLENRQKEKFFNNIDILILPSVYDPWGLIINEAINRNIPVIVTETCGVSQIVSKYQTGIVIKKLKELPQAINKIIINYSFFSENCNIYKKENNIIDNMVNPILQIINTINNF